MERTGERLIRGTGFTEETRHGASSASVAPPPPPFFAIFHLKRLSSFWIGLERKVYVIVKVKVRSFVVSFRIVFVCFLLKEILHFFGFSFNYGSTTFTIGL